MSELFSVAILKQCKLNTPFELEEFKLPECSVIAR